MKETWIDKRADSCAPHLRRWRRWRVLLTACALGLASACSSILPTPEEQPVYLSLDRVSPAHGISQPSSAGAATLTVLVEAPHAAAGFDSQRIIYLRRAHQVEYFARHQWIDTPSRMVAPLIVAALQDYGAFHAVLLAPAGAAGDLRVEAGNLHLQQEFFSKPSQVRFGLSAFVVDNKTRQVLAKRTFEAVVAAPHDDPYGGAVAANQAVAKVLQELAVFVADTAKAMPPRQPASGE
jgi:cholesterol transport system auxiliary component